MVLCFVFFVVVKEKLYRVVVGVVDLEILSRFRESTFEFMLDFISRKMEKVLELVLNFEVVIYMVLDGLFNFIEFVFFFVNRTEINIYF